MSVSQPSQYQCDNMQQGDIIYVRDRGIFYKIYRNLFLKDKKLQLKIKNNEGLYSTYYQEDCTLIYSYELKCVQHIESKIPYNIIYKDSYYIKRGILKGIDVSLYNIDLKFKKFNVLVPLEDIENAITKNKQLYEQLMELQQKQDNIKYQRYKGNTFRQIVKDRDIQEWTASYCSVCGKSVKFIFKDDIVLIDNACECGNMILKKQHFSYEEFALWYTQQTNAIIKKRYKNFWFDSKD